MITYSYSIVDAQKVKLASLEEEIAAAESRIAALKESIRYESAKLEGMLAMIAPKAAKEAPIPPAHMKRIGRIPTADVKPKRDISDKWRPIFECIAKQAGASRDEIAGVARAKGIERKLVRSQLRYYISKNYINLDGINGKYSITDIGRDVSGLPKGETPSVSRTEGFNFANPAPTGVQL